MFRAHLVDSHVQNDVEVKQLRYKTGGTYRSFPRRFWRKLKWMPIPIGVGLVYISFQQYGHIVKREKRMVANATTPEDILAKDWQVFTYRILPLRAISRLWGRVNSWELPVFMRAPVLGWYARVFHCNMDEALIPDLTHYKNLGEFFKRRLLPNARTVDIQHALVCPSDGKVLHLGRATHGVVEQVKGVSYDLRKFIGVPRTAPSGSTHGDDEQTDEQLAQQYSQQLKVHAGNELYHCVVYLAPGDYHGFHSPADWSISSRTHFPGDLLSVNPGIARWVRGLFNYNERAVYVGRWTNGFFSMAAVGATNVGSIQVYHDKELQSNRPGRIPPGATYALDYTQDKPSRDVRMRKGEAFGEFNLGSTIVLIFEAPADFRFCVRPDQRVQYGQPLGWTAGELPPENKPPPGTHSERYNPASTNT